MNPCTVVAGILCAYLLAVVAGLVAMAVGAHRDLREGQRSRRR